MIKGIARPTKRGQVNIGRNKSQTHYRGKGKLFFSNLTSQELLKSSKKKVIPSQEWVILSQEWVILSQDWVIPRQDLVNSSQCKFKWIIYNSQFIHNFLLKLYSWKLDELESNLINEIQKEFRSQFCKLTLSCWSDREEKFTLCWTVGIEKFT